MVEFYEAVDMRSRKAMTVFLSEHFRYHTMSSWNQSTSYAHNMKIYNLGLERNITEKLYVMMQTDEFHDQLHDLMLEFAKDHNHLWQAGMNGRSGGYLVLYQGERYPSGYKSYCPKCRQRNFTSITQTGNICGACRNPSRIDYLTTHMQSHVFPGRSTDMYENFEDWDMYDLRKRVKLVQDFDRLADAMVQEALYMAKNMEVEDETFYVAQQRKVLVSGAC